MDAVATAGGISEQACNECRRRKGRCDRTLPQCTPCSRFKRHCLYSEHSRTPLTRRHLTNVEEHLRQTRHQLRCMHQRALAAETQLQGSASQSPGGHGPETETAANRTLTEAVAPHRTFSPLHEGSSSVNQLADHGIGVEADQDASGPYFPRAESAQAQAQFANTTGELAVASQHIVPAQSQPGSASANGHISDAEDLSWDEQTPHQPSAGTHGSAALEERASVADGMASLSVEAKGTGYLGSASGAAMLRMLLPTDQRRRSFQSSSQSSGAAQGRARHAQPPSQGWVPTRVYHDRNIASIDLDAAIDAYFSLYHVSYPIVHEPSFRAQYMQVISRPSGNSWNALAYTVGALGIFTKAPGSDDRDLDLFEAAKANISLESLESGNLTLVQTLTLMSNYLQKRNKPNSGYNYLGLALHMAMGIGLHENFASLKVRPLAMEIRRRVWWTLKVFAVGAMITFGRPLSWPAHGVEAALPMNIDERDLTHASTSLPSAREGITAYSAVIWQTRFHLSTNAIYTKVINASFSSVDELLMLDDQHIEPWRQQWARQVEELPQRFKLSRSIMEWRYRNFRIIMYRPFVIRHALQSQWDSRDSQSGAVTSAIARCMHEARESVHSIRNYWNSGERNRMSAWYALYFLFQASLIPCVRLRNEPGSIHALDWRAQILAALDVIKDNDMGQLNKASTECAQVISRLCDAYLRQDGSSKSGNGMLLDPIEESPLTQIDNIYSMMWPGTDMLDFRMDGQFSQDNLDFDFDIPLE